MEFGSHLTNDVDTLGFQLFEMREDYNLSSLARMRLSQSVVGNIQKSGEDIRIPTTIKTVPCLLNAVDAESSPICDASGRVHNAQLGADSTLRTLRIRWHLAVKTRHKRSPARFHGSEEFPSRAAASDNNSATATSLADRKYLPLPTTRPMGYIAAEIGTRGSVPRPVSIPDVNGVRKRGPCRVWN